MPIDRERYNATTPPPLPEALPGVIKAWGGKLLSWLKAELYRVQRAMPWARVWDARDFRIGEGGDDTPKLEKLINAMADGSSAFFPAGMIVRLGSCLTIEGRNGLLFFTESTSEPNGVDDACQFIWDGDLGGRMINRDRCKFVQFRGIVFRPLASGCIEGWCGSITASDTTLTETGVGQWSATDVGMRIVVRDAGPDDDNGDPTDLITRVASFTSSTEIELADAASNSVTLARWIRGTTNSLPANCAIDSDGEAGYGYGTNVTGIVVAMTSGKKVVTATEVIFYPDQIGRMMVISGAGAAGIDLVTTITGWISGKKVTVSTSASTTVSDVAWVIEGYRSTGATSGASITSGTNTLTVSSGPFTSDMVNRLVRVQGAGSGTSAMLWTTITGYTSATQVTVAANATNTVSGVPWTLTSGTSAFGSHCIDDKCQFHVPVRYPDLDFLRFSVTAGGNHEYYEIKRPVFFGGDQCADAPISVSGTASSTAVTSSSQFVTGRRGFRIRIANARAGTSGNKTWDPPSVADGSSTTTTVSVTGAKKLEEIDVTFSISLSGCTLSGEVTNPGEVTVTLSNDTGGAVDLGSGTLTATRKTVLDTRLTAIADTSNATLEDAPDYDFTDAYTIVGEAEGRHIVIGKSPNAIMFKIEFPNYTNFARALDNGGSYRTTHASFANGETCYYIRGTSRTLQHHADIEEGCGQALHVVEASGPLVWTGGNMDVQQCRPNTGFVQFDAATAIVFTGVGLGSSPPDSTTVYDFGSGAYLFHGKGNYYQPGITLDELGYGDVAPGSAVIYSEGESGVSDTPASCFSINGTQKYSAPDTYTERFALWAEGLLNAGSGGMAAFKATLKPIASGSTGTAAVIDAQADDNNIGIGQLLLMYRSRLKWRSGASNGNGVIHYYAEEPDMTDGTITDLIAFLAEDQSNANVTNPWGFLQRGGDTINQYAGQSRLYGGVAESIRTVTGNATLTVNDIVILADATSGNLTITLMPVTSKPAVWVKKIDASANTVTVQGGTGTVDGAATKVLTTQWEGYKFSSNGTNWFVF